MVHTLISRWDMRTVPGHLSTRVAVRCGWRCCIWVLPLSLMACGRPPTSSAGGAKPPSQTAQGRVTLTPQAEDRLGIVAGLVPVARASQPARRLLRGEVTAPPGGSAWVIAPQPGVLLPPTGPAWVRAGEHVRAGQVLASLAASLAPTERAQISTVRVDADAQVARAQVQDDAAELALRRAERLFADDAVGAKVVDDARAQRETARTALKAALSQRAAIVGGETPAGTGRGALAQTQIVSPLSGTVRDLRVAAGQQVLTGTLLWEIVSDGPLWVRVAVPAGELATLVPGAAAEVEELSAPPTTHPEIAPAADGAPQTAGSGTVDRYFALSIAPRFSVGQSVAVWMPVRGDVDVPTVPATATLYDPSGAAWVYERVAEQQFLRRRVEVVRTHAGQSTLSERSLRPGGLHIGSSIVTAGAMELYGAEFSGGK